MMMTVNAFIKAFTAADLLISKKSNELSDFKFWIGDLVEILDQVEITPNKSWCSKIESVKVYRSDDLIFRSDDEVKILTRKEPQGVPAPCGAPINCGCNDECVDCQYNSNLH